jgi:hypothetical protein
VIDTAPPEVGDVIQRLGVEDSDAAAIDVIAGLAWNAAGRALDDLQLQARRHSDDLSVIRDTARLQGLREKVQPPDPEPEALDELLTWLTGQAEEQP